MKKLVVLFVMTLVLCGAGAVKAAEKVAVPGANDEQTETINDGESKDRVEAERDKDRDPDRKMSAPDDSRRDAPVGFDKYPKRTYKFLFNNVLSNVLYRSGGWAALITVPAGTIPAVQTFESGYSMVERLSNYPVNLLYDKIGGWTGLVMLAKVVLLDFPFAYTMKVFNHEFSGHTARYVESGQPIDSIHVGVPLPWGSGGGVTYGYITRSIDKDIFISAAGSEANTVMAHEMSLGFVSNGVIYPYDILLYLNARFDQLLYINNATSHPSGLRMLVDGDYQDYLVAINNKYGQIFPATYRLKLGEIQRWAYIALADPFLYMATGAFFYNLFTGKRYMKTWMIPLGSGVSIMPSARVAYTPNGPECFGDLFIQLQRRAVLLVYGRGSGSSLRRTWGGGVRLYTLDLGPYAEVGGGVDFFSQPRVMNGTSTMYLENMFWNLYPLVNPLGQYDLLTSVDLLNGRRARLMRRMFGGAAYADLTVKAGDLFRAYLRMGYKSSGYVFGMKLAQGFFWHTGVGFNF